MNLDPVLQLLRELSATRSGTLGELIAAVQQDLRAIAHRERVVIGAGPTLSTTALVNEAYIRLSEGRLPAAMDRRHFFGVAARAMRQILVDYARARGAAKRGGGKPHDSLSAADAEIAALLEVDESTVRRDWAKARGWLFQRLHAGEPR